MSCSPSPGRGPRSAAFFLLAAVILLALPARADIVHLKNGRSIEGIVSPGSKKGTIEVRSGEGVQVVLREEDIARIEKKRSPQDDLEAKLKDAPAGELEPLEEILVWARDKGLGTRVKAVARAILEIDPNSEPARKALGHVVHENRWILETELKKKGLIVFRGEWMTEAEKARRLEEDLRKEIEDHLGLVDSENPYIQEFSVRKILSRREPVAREVFHAHLSDRREGVRMVAIRGLISFPVKSAGDEAAKRIALDLHRVLLREKSDGVLQVIYATVGKFYPRESFELALETARSSREPSERARAAEVLHQTLRKEWVPELCAAAAGGDGAQQPGSEAVRAVLRRALGVDMGGDAAAWRKWWEENKARFTDE